MILGDHTFRASPFFDHHQLINMLFARGLQVNSLKSACGMLEASFSAGLTNGSCFSKQS